MERARLQALRRVAFEAADSGFLSPELAAGIRDSGPNPDHFWILKGFEMILAMTAYAVDRITVCKINTIERRKMRRSLPISDGRRQLSDGRRQPIHSA